MAEVSLTAELAASFDTLDDLIAQHRKSEAHDIALERVHYLHAQLQSLRSELRALRRCADIARRLSRGIQEANLWRQTIDDLRRQLPQALQSPAQTIEAGDSALLDLVSSVAAAGALVRERRARLVAALEPALGSMIDGCANLSAADATAVIAALEMIDLPQAG